MPDHTANEIQLAILEALADGVHPLTGEELPDRDLCRDKQVHAALRAGMKALEKRVTIDDRRAKPPGKAGNPWGPEEDGRLVESFEAGRSITELAKIHGRTEGAIRSRLTKHGKFAP